MFEPAHYNAVFEAMRRRFGEDWYQSVDPKQWNIWRKQIKDWFFLEGILIAEMVAGLDEAAGKGRWPIGTSFFQRLHDVVLVTRRDQQRRSNVQINRGPESLTSLLTNHR
jgi:hypothetical protein